jgi:hypothetical protein
MQEIFGRGKIVPQAFLFLNGTQFKVKPPISYCMLKHLFEITSSNSHTHLTPGEHINKQSIESRPCQDKCDL